MSIRPVPDKPIRLNAVSVEDQLARIPQGLYQANRYDTDNESKVHIWNAQGQSFDITVPKLPPQGPRFV